MSLISIAAELKAYPASDMEGGQATREGIVAAPFDAYGLSQTVLEAIETGLKQIEDVNATPSELSEAQSVLELLLGELASIRDVLLGTVNARRIQRGLPIVGGFGIPDN